MAYPHKCIANPVTGQQIRFIRTARDTGGALLEMQSAFGPHSVEPPAHFHPLQEEEFTILEGCLCTRINGHLEVWEEGDVFRIPRGAVHAMWNASDLPALVQWTVTPALGTEYFFETAMGLAKDGRLGASGKPRILQAALLAQQFRKEFRLAKPHPLLQGVLFTFLRPLARLRGYRAIYPEYID